VASDAHALPTKHTEHARTAVPTLALLEHGANGERKPSVVDGMVGLLPRERKRAL
jgi:hypothetical protein